MLIFPVNRLDQPPLNAEVRSEEPIKRVSTAEDAAASSCSRATIINGGDPLWIVDVTNRLPVSNLK